MWHGNNNRGIMMSIRNKIIAGTIAGLCAALAPLAAVAQEGGVERLDEIVITAQKREQRLQDVPIAVSVVSGALAESTGGYNIETLRALVPSLNIRKTNTSLNQSVFLRGVGTINFAIAAQPSVATVVDGVVLASAGEAFGDLYDIERVEVLRGPQGTLFGKNASAGVVNIVTKRPGSEFGGYFDIGYYEDDELRLKAAVDLPVTDNVRSRTTATWGDFNGYISNVSSTAGGGTMNGYNRKGVRSVWDIDGETSRWSLAFDYRKSDDNCCVEVIGTRPTGANGPALVSLLSGVDFQGDETRTVRQNLQMRSYEESLGFSMQGDIDWGDKTVTSITAYRTWDATEIREGDWLDTPAAYVGNAFAQLHDFGPQETKTLSQELRVASAGGETVDYVAGVYFSKTDAERFFRRDTIVCRSTTLAPDATGLAPCRSGASVIDTTPSANATFGAKFQNLAAFVDGNWNISDSLRAIGGLRYTRDELSYYHTYNFSPAPGPGIRNAPAGTLPAQLGGSNDSDNLSGRVGMQFDATDDVMLYATYARGYKGPAYNVFFNMGVNNTPVIDEETVDSYEIGLKSSLLDGRMLLNLAAFNAKYDGFQANNFLFLNGTLITTLTNAGKVSSEGAELDFQYQPNDFLMLGGGVAYTKAQVDKFFTPPGSTPSVRDGTQLPLAPELKGSLVAELNIPVGTWTLSPNVLVSYTDDQFSDLNEPVALLIPGYTTVDVTLALTDADDRIRVSLVGRNVTDEAYTALKTGGGPGGVPRLQIPRDADRYFGIQARFRFGGK
jgi:iron complex outermembrane receptor protein